MSDKCGAMVDLAVRTGRSAVGEDRPRMESTCVPSPICTSNPRTDGADWEPWEGNGPCQDCGQRNVVWTVDNATWGAVMGSAGGLLCPSCFIVRAHAAGLAGQWTLRYGEQG